MAKQRWFFATCTKGLEGVLAGEVEALGGTAVRTDRGGVAFQGSAAVGIRVVFWSRVAVRVLEELARGKVSDADGLYAVARRVPWERLLHADQTFAVTAVVRDNPAFRHAHFAALRVKDAVADHLTALRGSRSDVDPDDPDLPLRVVIHGRVATISRDLAGESLHRRGWRPVTHVSPLAETLAAGLLLLSDWDRTSPLCDPMCGSGTLLVEAAHLAGDRAPGLRRSFAGERWIDRDRAAWDAVRADAEARWDAGRRALPALCGNDASGEAIAIARLSVEAAELSGQIALTRGDVSAYVPPVQPAWVVSNPPWGQRLEDGADESWRALGAFLKARCPESTAWLLAGEGSPTRALGMRATRKIPVWSGPIECRWLRYPVGPARG